MLTCLMIYFRNKKPKKFKTWIIQPFEQNENTKRARIQNLKISYDTSNK